MGAQFGSPAAANMRHRRLGVALALVAFCCAVAIEALHGHACTGDGCVLCLAVAFANALLFASVSMTLALPVVRALGGLRALRMGVMPRRASHVSPMAPSRARRVELTPVTMGVRLII